MLLVDILKFVTHHPLNREHKLKAVFRFAQWQIRSRLVRGEIVHDWVNGAKFYVESGVTTLTGNIYTGLYEYAEMAYVLHVLRKEDQFIDVGANVGSYTILACAAAGARGISFEPVPDTYHRLLRNIRLNRMEHRVTCINKAVAAEPGTIAFTRDSGAENHALASAERNDSAIEVEVTPLDNAIRGEFPGLAKIDVEGYETRVLEGAEETLKNPSLHSVIMELNGSGNRYGFDESKILQRMFDYGFKTYKYNPPDRSLTLLQGKNPDSENTLFVRNKAFVEERLRTAPPFTVHGTKI